MRQADFGFGFGMRPRVPMMLEELRALPQMCPSLRETAFYMAGFNWFVDWVVMPLILLGGRLAPRWTRKPLAYLLHWGTRLYANPPVRHGHPARGMRLAGLRTTKAFGAGLSP